MGYCEDLIQRMKTDRVWEHLTDDQRREFEQLSDERAGKMMATFDWWQMGDPETNQQVDKLMLNESVKAFLSVFGGRLLELQGENIGKLSKAGVLLAEFIAELEEQGIDWAAISDDFAKLNNTHLIIGLRYMYKRHKEQP